MSGATVIRQVLTFHKLSAGDGANKSATPLQLAHAPDDGTTANQSPRRPGNPAERWSTLEQRLVPSRAPPFYRTSSHPTRLVGLFACSLPLLRTTQHSCRQGSHSPVGHALHTPTSLPSHNSTEKKTKKKTLHLSDAICSSSSHMGTVLARNRKKKKGRKKRCSGLMLNRTCMSNARR